MRFAIATYDRYLGIFEAFCHAGWVPVKLFTVPLRDPQFGDQRASIALAEQKGVPTQLSRMSQQDIADLGREGCDALVVAGYDWKVLEWSPPLRYAINFHPSPLPVGRGAYPLPRAILENHPTWGVTCHRLTAQIDAGEILAAEHFPLRADECHESLDLRVQIAGRRLADRVARNFAELWRTAAPQGNGTYWPKITLADKCVDLSRPVDDLLCHMRAYGLTGSLANVAGTWHIVRRAAGWQEAHEYPAGTVIHSYARTVVVAVADGYLAILDSEVVPPHLAAQITAIQQRR
jgi:methionyl-tRNA formyltransferase